MNQKKKKKNFHHSNSRDLAVKVRRNHEVQDFLGWRQNQGEPIRRKFLRLFRASIVTCRNSMWPKNDNWFNKPFISLQRMYRVFVMLWRHQNGNVWHRGFKTGVHFDYKIFFLTITQFLLTLMTALDPDLCKFLIFKKWQLSDSH